jgi:predicted permease
METMTTWSQDVRYALRQLRKTPGFTLTAVLTLALGIGANGAIFTLVHAVLLKNLPVADPRMLVRVGDKNDCCVGFGARASGDYSLLPTAYYELLRKNAPEFEDLAAIQAGFLYRPVIARRDGTQESARSVMGEFVSGNYFKTFGLNPTAGRLFTDADDVEGAPTVAVVSFETWKHNYGGDPTIVGSTFYINTKPVTIAGIAPEGFYGDRLSSAPPDFYLPMEAMPLLANVSYVHDPNANWIYIIGRVRPGVSLSALQAKANVLLHQSLVNLKLYSSDEGKLNLAKAHVILTPGGAGIQSMQEQYASHLNLLMGAAGLVLLIACANIANLLLVRGMARKTEMSVRSALGAQRVRIVRQLLTESLVLAILGGIAGLAVGYLGSRMLLALAFPGAQAVPINASPSAAVLGFAFALTLLTGVLFGMAPAWFGAQAQPADALRSGTRTTTGGATLLQRSLVVGQAALSLVLLVGAGLFAQSLGKLQGTDMKLDPINRYIVHINPQAAGYSQRQVGDLYRLIEERFHALPGVEKVGLSTYTPMEDNNDAWSVVVQGKPDQHISASFVKATPEYFDSVGTRVVMGRGIEPSDTSTSPTIAVVNETFVKSMFKPGENPIGQHFGGGSNTAGDYEIVGVVQDTTYTTVRWKDHLMSFYPILQRPASDTTPIEKDEMLYAGAIVIKTSRPMNDMEELARQTLSGINPNLSVVKFQTFQAQIDDTFTEDRLLARLTMLFGVLALLLATIGLYGVTAYGVARRTAEIGIRMALGAERSRVTAMIMRGALLQAALGLAIGVPIALLSVHWIKSQLYEITSVSATVMALAIGTLALAATLAGWIPARRAAATEPARALRTE